MRNFTLKVYGKRSTHPEYIFVRYNGEVIKRELTESPKVCFTYTAEDVPLLLWIALEYVKSEDEKIVSHSVIAPRLLSNRWAISVVTEKI